jgi:hypothetical protein
MNTTRRLWTGWKPFDARLFLPRDPDVFWLLTNPKVMGSEILTPQDAFGVYRALRSDERLWVSLMAVPSANGSVWTDAWLAAFALAQ